MSEYPEISDNGNRYRVIEYDGQPAHEYESGAVLHPETGKVLKPMITRANAVSLQKKSVESRRAKYREAIEAGVRAAVSDVEPDVSELDRYQAAGVMAGWLVHIIAEGGNAGVKAYSELMRDLGLRDRDSVQVTDSQGNSVKVAGKSFDELLDMLHGFDNSNYQKHNGDIVDGVLLDDQAEAADSGGDSESGEEKASPPTSE